MEDMEHSDYNSLIECDNSLFIMDELVSEESSNIERQKKSASHNENDSLESHTENGNVLNISFSDNPFRLQEIPSISTDRLLRPIVIDGSSVAFGVNGSWSEFSSKGIKKCYDYFLNRGHVVKIFIPWFRRRCPNTLDTYILDRLDQNKCLIYTPSKIYACGKEVAANHTRYVIEYATICGGIIVSRSNFSKFSNENSNWEKTINERVLSFTWVDDIIMFFPQNPLEPSQLQWENFLTFPERPKVGEKE